MNVKPCPFCGHQPEDRRDFFHPTGTVWQDRLLNGRKFRTYHRHGTKEYDGRCWVLACLTHEGGCGAEMSGDSEEDTLERWNRRA